MRNPKDLDLSPLRSMLNGSKPVHRATIERFEAAFAPLGLRKGVVFLCACAESVLGVSVQPQGAPEADLSLEGRVEVPSCGGRLRSLEVTMRNEAGDVVDEGRGR